MLAALAEDELGLLVLDVGLRKLAADNGELEPRQVLAGQVARDVGGGEGQPTSEELQNKKTFLEDNGQYPRTILIS